MLAGGTRFRPDNETVAAARPVPAQARVPGRQTTRPGSLRSGPALAAASMTVRPGGRFYSALACPIQGPPGGRCAPGKSGPVRSKILRAHRPTAENRPPLGKPKKPPEERAAARLQGWKRRKIFPPASSARPARGGKNWKHAVGVKAHAKPSKRAISLAAPAAATTSSYPQKQYSVSFSQSLARTRLHLMQSATGFTRSAPALACRVACALGRTIR